MTRSRSDRPRARPDWEIFARRCEEAAVRAEYLPAPAEDFAAGVIGTLRGMGGSARERRSASDRMWQALSNITEGIRRWEERDDD